MRSCVRVKIWRFTRLKIFFFPLCTAKLSGLIKNQDISRWIFLDNAHLCPINSHLQPFEHSRCAVIFLNFLFYPWTLFVKQKNHTVGKIRIIHQSIFWRIEKCKWRYELQVLISSHDIGSWDICVEVMNEIRHGIIWLKDVHIHNHQRIHRVGFGIPFNLRKLKHLQRFIWKIAHALMIDFLRSPHQSSSKSVIWSHWDSWWKLDKSLSQRYWRQLFRNCSSLGPKFTPIAL